MSARNRAEPPPSPYGRPSAAELVEAVRELLAGTVADATEGEVRHQVRVAVHVLRIVERELALGTAHRDAHQERLRQLGVASDAELAALVRSGQADGRADVRRALAADAADRLAVANPDWLQDPPARGSAPPGGPPPGGP